MNAGRIRILFHCKNSLSDKGLCTVGGSFRCASFTADDYDSFKEEFDIFKVEESSEPLALAGVHVQPSKPTIFANSVLPLPSSLKHESIVLTSTLSSQSGLTEKLPSLVLVKENKDEEVVSLEHEVLYSICSMKYRIRMKISQVP